MTLFAVLVAALTTCSLSVDVTRLPRLATGLGGYEYYTDPILANGFVVAALEQRTSSAPDVWTKLSLPLSQSQPTQFNSTTILPLIVNPSQPVRGITWGLHTTPERTAHGVYSIVWTGAADVQPTWCTFLPGMSNGPAQGVIVDGRRVFNCSGGPLFYVQILNASDSARPLTSLKVMLPDPDAPFARSLPESTLFHPQFIKHLNTNSPKYGGYRFMDLFHTNANSVSHWAERNKPTHAVFNVPLADRGPFGSKYDTRSSSGIPYEYAPALCNLQSVDCWINIPHQATDDFITKMAQLLRFGTDAAGMPLTSDNGSPAWAPLRADLRLFVEYSNEIWSNGPSFAQGEWAEAEGVKLGLSKAQFNAKRSCEIFAIFDRVFGARSTQIVRVAAAFTALDSYTLPYLQHMASTDNCAPDIVAVTTYFGNGIQDHVHLERRDIWYDHANTSDPYWQSAQYTQDLDDVYDEWLVRLLSGSATAGGGFDATGLSGGFGLTLVRAALNTTLWKGRTLAVVAYEGGPSIYTDYIDNSWMNTPETLKTRFVTEVCAELNRRDRMEEVYRAHLTLAFARGLQQHSQFTDHGGWSKYGQWGARESVFDVDSMQPKLRALSSIDTEWSCVSPSMIAQLAVAANSSAVPLRFTTTELPVATFNAMYDAEIHFTHNGETPSASAVLVQVISTANVRGLTVLTLCRSKPGVIRIVGIPKRPRTLNGFIMLRLSTTDGSAVTVATFKVTHVGAPDSVVTADLSTKDVCVGRSGTAAISATVGTPNVALVAQYDGVTIASLSAEGNGAEGCRVRSSPQAMPGSLDAAIAANRSLSLRFTTARALDLRGAVISLGLTRVSYHADRQFAVFVNRFAAADRVGGTSTDFTSTDPSVLPLVLSDDESRLQIAANTAVEIRIVPFNGQYSHSIVFTSIGVRITRGVGNVVSTEPDFSQLRSQWCSDYLDVKPCQAFVPPPTTTSTGGGETVTVDAGTASVTSGSIDSSNSNDMLSGSDTETMAVSGASSSVVFGAAAVVSTAASILL